MFCMWVRLHHNSLTVGLSVPQYSAFATACTAILCWWGRLRLVGKHYAREVGSTAILWLCGRLFCSTLPHVCGVGLTGMLCLSGRPYRSTLPVWYTVPQHSTCKVDGTAILVLHGRPSCMLLCVELWRLNQEALPVRAVPNRICRNVDAWSISCEPCGNASSVAAPPQKKKKAFAHGFYGVA